MRSPLRFVLTGGPGGGKTRFLEGAHRYLEGKVVVVPEAATGLKDLEPDLCRPRSDSVEFQLEVLQAQLKAEAGLLSHPEVKYALLDRGIFDGVAFIQPHEYRAILAQVGLSEVEAVMRYDGIVFVYSAAPLLGAAAIQRIPVNERSFVEHVKVAESRLLNVVLRHKNLEFVQAQEDFLDKCRAIASAVETVYSRCH